MPFWWKIRDYDSLFVTWSCMFCTQWCYKATNPTHLSFLFSFLPWSPEELFSPSLNHWSPVYFCFSSSDSGLAQHGSVNPTRHLAVPSSGSYKVLRDCLRLLMNWQGQLPCWHATLKYPHTLLYRLLPLSPVTNTPSLQLVFSAGWFQHNRDPALLVLVIAESVQITRCDEVYRRWGRGFIKVTELQPDDLCIYSSLRNLRLKRSGNLTGHWPNPYCEGVRGWRGQERRDKSYTAGHMAMHSKLTCVENKKRKASVVCVRDDFCLHTSCG